MSFFYLKCYIYYNKEYKIMAFLDYNPASQYSDKAKRISELETEIENISVELFDDEISDEQRLALKVQLQEAEAEYKQLQ